MTDNTIPADQDATTDRRGRATYLSPETIARTVERGIEQAHRYDTADQGDTSLTDKLRETIAAHYAENEGDELKSDLLALLPKPRTLADMNLGERRECKWMQADTEVWGRVVIVDPQASGIRAGVLDRRGNMSYTGHSTLTPLPDLPRMEWPGEQKPSPDLPDGWRLADHPDHGRVIVTKPTPGNNEHVHFVHPNYALVVGCDWGLCDAAELIFLDTTQEKNND